MQPEWWHWAIAGIVLILSELAVPAFVLVWFGLGAILVGIIMLLLPISLAGQFTLWAVASSAMVLLWFRVVKNPDRTKAGFHDRALASFMTGVEPTKGKVHVGISVDQVAAKVLGKETQFASLELGTEKLNVNNNQTIRRSG